MRLVVTLAIALLLAGCVNPAPTKGTITARTRVPIPNVGVATPRVQPATGSPKEGGLGLIADERMGLGGKETRISDGIDAAEIDEVVATRGASLQRLLRPRTLHEPKARRENLHSFRGRDERDGLLRRGRLVDDE